MRRERERERKGGRERDREGEAANPPFLLQTMPKVKVKRDDDGDDDTLKCFEL